MKQDQHQKWQDIVIATAAGSVLCRPGSAFGQKVVQGLQQNLEGFQQSACASRARQARLMPFLSFCWICHRLEGLEPAFTREPRSLVVKWTRTDYSQTDSRQLLTNFQCDCRLQQSLAQPQQHSNLRNLEHIYGKPDPFAALIPGNSVAEQVLTSGFSSTLYVYTSNLSNHLGIQENCTFMLAP